MSAVGNAVGGLLGGITGANQAADAQSEAARQSAQLSREQFKKLEKNLSPFRKLGVDSIMNLVESAKRLNADESLQDFYNSGEYGLMSAQANNNLMAQQEALGGLGSSATANSLQRVAPMLGQQHLGQLYARQADDFNRQMGLVSLGQNAAAQTGAAGQNYASQAGQAYQQGAQAQAQSAMSTLPTLLGAGSLGLAAYTGGLF